MTLWSVFLDSTRGTVVTTWGLTGEASRALAREGFTSMRWEDARPEHRHHAVVLVSRSTRRTIDQAAARVGPGGTLVLGVPVGASAQRTLRATAAALTSCGLVVDSVSWAGPTWTEPAWSVPADSAPAARWFVRDCHVPWSRKQLAASVLLGAVLPRLAVRLLAAGVVVVAHREQRLEEQRC